MNSFHEYMNDFRTQLKKGGIIKAYQGFMDYFRGLRNHFSSAFPQYSVPGNIYYGYLDMTYFAIMPEFLKQRKLKIAIVFVYETYRFEVWLSGMNRKVQTRYSLIIKEKGWDKYHLTTNPKGEDSILDQILVEDPDFSDLDLLTEQIENGTRQFITDVENFLSQHDN